MYLCCISLSLRCLYTHGKRKKRAAKSVEIPNERMLKIHVKSPKRHGALQ